MSNYRPFEEGTDMRREPTQGFFYTKAQGVGGRIKKRAFDFIVKEITPEGKKCEILAFDKEDGTKNIVEKNWPEPTGQEQLLLTLEKFNTDLNFAIRYMARGMHLSGKRFGYAGMKDKRAVTSQRISIWKPDYEKVKNFTNRFLSLREAEWSDKRIELGDLWGNEFEITVREIELDENETRKRINECIAEIEKGIPNFFGLQRFGGVREITHLVGREILRGNIEGAVMLYLTSTAPEEDEETKNARQQLAATMDFAQASKSFPTRLRYERAIIHHLCRYPRDFAGALGMLPKYLRIMFTHAYQSHLFNKVVRWRVEQGLGLEPLEGDILLEGIATAPLFGFESELAQGKPGEIEKQVLEEEGIGLKDFKLKVLSELSSKGKRKQLALSPKNLSIKEVGKDEFTEGCTKAVIGFYLSKGNYATTVIREIMKKEPR
ncbi:MAG: tRNA pseudouridine(13) synthase TruD [Candidatus Diapherotrites archaeon]|nr:tRNA pseudouridine(13) synthase TruD [Candidatus Diapherotrites archaeon]